VRRAGRLPLAVGYVPRGPLLRQADDPDAWAGVLAGLEAWARARRLVLLKIDPDVPAAATAVEDAWRARGWISSAEQIQFPNTMESDLSGGPEALLAAMKPKTRYNIRLAERRGVTIRAGTTDDLPAFFALYAETARRNDFAIRVPEYYIDAASHFLAAGDAALLLAEREGRLLSGVVPVAYGPTTWYLYGASADEGREHMASYLAQWASLEWAVARGCRRYDWWGGPTGLDPSDPLWGVYRFKDGFGARWVRQLGAWDYAPSPLLHRLYRLAADRRKRPPPGAR
jgi:lipid II:glycine glycyltransferase (peptidoglycan interpeptide bridge formation enzyme)